jgi:hypothetical protein
MTCDISDPHSAVRAVVLFVSTGVLLSSLEWVALFREFRKGGTYDWEVVRTLHRFPPARAIDFLLTRAAAPQVVSLILSFRVASAVWCMLWCVLCTESVPLFPLAVLSLTGLYVNYRTRYGLEASDQMLMIVCISLVLGSLIESDTGEELALYFIAAQAILSYFVAGISKLFGSLWRSGEAVRLIVNTQSFGHPYFAGVLNRQPALGRVAALAVLVIECSFPLVLILPPSVTYMYIVLVFVFHLLNCVVLGLNVFLWAYLATFPAILLSAHDFRLLVGVTSVN